MKILSFDVGIKNLAYTIVDCDDNFKILKFGIIDLNERKKCSKCKNFAVKFSFSEGEFKFCCKGHEDESNIQPLKDKKIDEKCKFIIKKFDEIFNKDEIDCIVIENQPSFRAPTLKSIQIMIFTYWCMFKDEVHFQNPVCKTFNSKLISDLDKKIKYRETKKLSIKMMEKLIDKDKLSEINKFKKRDDISDSYLHAVSFFTRHYNDNKIPEKIKDLI